MFGLCFDGSPHLAARCSRLLTSAFAPVNSLTKKEKNSLLGLCVCCKCMAPLLALGDVHVEWPTFPRAPEGRADKPGLQFHVTGAQSRLTEVEGCPLEGDLRLSGMNICQLPRGAPPKEKLKKDDCLQIR